MGYTMRSRDDSTKKVPIDIVIPGSQTNGDTGMICHIPWPSTIKAMNIAFLNPTPQVTVLFTVSRFIVGTGATTWNLGTTFIPQSYGTSGLPLLGVSLPPQASTLMMLMPNDILGYQIGGGATAGLFGMFGSVVVQPLQDVTTFMGTLT